MKRLTIGCGIGAVLMMAATAFSADFLRCDFAEMAGMNGSRKVKPSYYNDRRSHLAKLGSGVTGGAAIFAMDNLQVFQKFATEEPLKELPAIVYENLAGFPQKQGYFELTIAPYFNQIHTYYRKPADPEPYYYVALLYKHPVNTSLTTREGKSEIGVFMHRQKLSVRVKFTDGTQSVLSTPVKGWEAGKYHKIILAWGPESQRLFVDGKLADSSKKKGELDAFTALELGGRDYSLSFQGLIDSIRIADGEPAVK